MKQNYVSFIKSASLFLFFLTFLFTQNISAEEYKGFHKGIRPLGMGGAFTAVADDHNSIFYNTAGLAQADGFGIGILNPYVSVSENSIDLMNDFNDADTDNTEEVNNLMKDYVGETNNIKVATDIYTGFKVKNVGIMVSAIGQADTTITIHNPVWPEAHIKAVVDYGAIIGAGVDVPMVKGLKLGASIKAITRESLDEVYTALDIADDDTDFADRIEDDMQSGSGVCLDIGALYSVKGIPFTDLNLAFTGQNIPEMDFGDAVANKSQYNIGAALQQKFGILQLTEAIDYMDITDNLVGDDAIEKKLHFGVEAKIPVLSVRAGLNQGYYTVGASVDLKIIRFDVVSYGEEIGVYAGQKEDRRLAAQVSMGWLW